jgi:two-component system nitrate/nitrite response regulator NarL
LREGIVTILERHADLEVVAVAEDADTALACVSDSEARVVLVDAGLGDHDSHRLVERIARAFPEVRVIVMDVLLEGEEVVEFVKRGASGFVVKNGSIDDFVGTIRSVAEGREVLPPVLTTTLFSHVAQQAVARAGSGMDTDVQVTPREREVIDLIAEGLSNKAIATRLGISTHTVKSHVRNILEKLALHSRLQVAAFMHQAEESEEQPD